jgi:hypothetical protein
MRTVAHVVALLLLALTDCPGSSNPCLNVVCAPAPDGGASGETCDPTDGLCKCGFSSTSAGVACQAHTSCDPVSGTCISTLCKGVICDALEICDPNDGLCKCNGEVCPKGVTCNMNTGCIEP